LHPPGEEERLPPAFPEAFHRRHRINTRVKLELVMEVYRQKKGAADAAPFSLRQVRSAPITFPEEPEHPFLSFDHPTSCTPPRRAA